MNDYKITEITGDAEAKYGKRRVTFKVEGNDKLMSGFFKFVPKVGDTLTGEIVPNGNYLNFKFGSKTTSSDTPGGDINRIEMKCDLILAQLKTLGGILTAMRDTTSQVDTDSPF